MSLHGAEIKEQIDLRTRLIEEALHPNKFTLNNTVATLMAEINELQNQCPHEYKDGYCVYCYKEEETWK